MNIDPRSLTSEKLPPLREGARMKQPEFHRRYESYPDSVKFELVGGTVYMASPARWPHGEFQEELRFLFGLYRRATPGVALAPEITTILGEESEPQPDLTLRIVPECGGRSHLNEAEYVVGPPELVAEIAYSTRDLAMNQKRQDYEQAGVLEYLVLCVAEQELHWFDFAAGDEIRPNRRGIWQSRVFPGLWIRGASLLARDSSRLTEVMNQGLASRAHAAFVRRLERARRRSGS